MKILLIGSGGRESALAYKLSTSPSVEEFFISPGNGGTGEYGENVLIISEHEGILQFCKDNKIDLVVVGPEQPLVEGLADYLRTNDIKTFGPSAKAAEIESSKSFAKHLMKKYSIPSAAYKEFSSEEYSQAAEYLKKTEYPVVIKADGLATGKGVIIANDEQSALNSLDDIFNKQVFGEAGRKIIIEEFMKGEEASIFAVTDGKDYVLLPASQDHKRIGNNDTGKNTGGMGAYAPAPIVNEKILRYIEENIIIPALHGLASEGRTFNGCLYAGVMINEEAVKVVEFNCRFGDPETQAVLPLLEGDFAQLLYSAASGSVDKKAVRYNGGACVTVVAASEGYPDAYKSGYEIEGIDTLHQDNILIFHAGTKSVNDKIITSGGRVLAVTAVTQGNNLLAAKVDAYNALSRIRFENIYYRTDIADKAFKYKD